MKTVLLTGSDGFIGSHIAKDLLDNRYRVIGLDNHSKYQFPSIDHHNNPNFDFHHWDLTINLNDNKDLIDPSYLGDCVGIIHCAALIGGIEYFHKHQYEIISQNACIDTNIIDYALDKKVKLIGLSSSMVYENTDTFPSTEESVDHIPPPSSSYGFSKLTMERMIKAAAEQHKLNYNIVRPFNAAGVGENDFLEGKSSHVIPDLVIKCLKKESPLTILGSGDQIRHFTHATDIARGIRYVLERANNTEIYNISSPISTKIRDLAKMIWNKINPNQELILESSNSLKYDIQKRVPSTIKAYHELGFKTEISLDQGLDEVINYIKSKI